MTNIIPPEVTRIEFVNAPGVERPTSTKVNLDPAILNSPSLVKYVFETRARIGMTMIGLSEVVSRDAGLVSDYNLAEQFMKAFEITSAIDAARFFNGDRVVSQIIRKVEYFQSLPENSTVYIDEVDDFFGLVFDNDKPPRREYAPEQQRAIDDGKRAAQAYERQQRLKKKKRKK